jgi:hypothetical protein
MRFLVLGIDIRQVLPFLQNKIRQKVVFAKSFSLRKIDINMALAYAKKREKSRERAKKRKKKIN